jgi:hypothetical protein
MKYYKLKITKTKDERDDAITHYSYGDIDSKLFKKTTMSDNEKFLYVSVDKDLPKGDRITKQDFDNKFKK